MWVQSAIGPFGAETIDEKPTWSTCAVLAAAVDGVWTHKERITRAHGDDLGIFGIDMRRVQSAVVIDL